MLSVGSAVAEDQEFVLPPLEERPLVTFALFAYNQEKYIREAIEGAFAQTYEPLEIILSDDCSTDQTFEIMEEMAAKYCGPHKIRTRKNANNFGVLLHVLSVAREANGAIFVVAAGDDISFLDRTQKILPHFVDKRICALSSDEIIIDEHGKEKNWDLKRFKMRDRWHRKSCSWLHGATAAYRTDFLTRLPLPSNAIHYEDMVFSDVMSLIGLKSIRLKKPLIKYRHHFNNLSNRRPQHSSIQHQENLRIEMWKKKLHAKVYCTDFARAQISSGGRIRPAVLRALLGEVKYLEHLSDWKNKSTGSGLALLYYGFRYGSVRECIVRALGENAFLLMKIGIKITRHFLRKFFYQPEI